MGFSFRNGKYFWSHDNDFINKKVKIIMKQSERAAKNPFKYSFVYYFSNPSDYIEHLNSWIGSNPKGWYAHVKANHKELIDFVNSKYQFMVDKPFHEKLYWFLNELTEFPLCQTCHEHHTRFISVKDGYAKWCCNKCAQSDESIQQKIIKTKIQRFGVPNNSQTDEFKNKMREKIKDRTLEEKQAIYNKRKNTCNKIYGHDHPMQGSISWARYKKTSMDRHGTEFPTQSKKVMEHCKRRCFELHGCEYTGQIKEKIDKTIDIFHDKYGGHPFRMGNDGKRIIEELNNISFEELKSRRYILCEDKQGKFTVYRKGDKYIISNDIVNIIQFDSKWEISVYVFCRENNILVQYHPGIKFRYYHGEKVHWYYPDFLINGKLFEVKGDHFFRINKSTGKEEMFCPYRYKHWSDERYNYECVKLELKHKCMLDNGVKIIRYSELNNLKEVLQQ